MREMALQILTQRYSGAAFAIAAGSLVRGEGTATSDLDLIVIFNSLPCAHRESFEWSGRPVEAFVHDPETVSYFMAEVDCKSGYPLMPHMILSGVIVPERSAMSDRLQAIARSMVEQGPPPLDVTQRTWMRYLVSDALDDLRSARSPEERVATAAALHDSLGNAYLRLRGKWSGKGKWLPRLLAQADAAFARRFTVAFDAIWRCGDCEQMATLVQEVLAPAGGLFHFSEGYYQAAKAEWRKPAWEHSKAYPPAGSSSCIAANCS